MTIDEMDLESDVAAKARLLQVLHPGVVFLSGRRTLAAQCLAMAHNELQAPGYVARTYANTEAKRRIVEVLLQVHGEHLDAGTLAGKFATALDDLTPEQKSYLSRHLTGRAFDLAPGSVPMAAVMELHPRRFLTHEGGLIRWHAEW